MADGSREQAEAHKARGNELLKAGKHLEAIEAYGFAIEADPEVAVFWSNRSAARLKAGDANGALLDAEETVRLRPDWAKGHHRQATAFQALGRPRDAASACSAGLKAAAGAEEAELKELRRLKKVMITAAAALALQGWWHGTVSAPLGGFDQDFHFMPDDALACVVYGNELLGKYLLADVEESKAGGLQGGLDVTLDSSTRVPYLFRIGDGGDGILHLCCPMKSPEDRPRSFDGPGYVAMRPGRAAGGDATALAELQGMAEGQKILRYLDELAEVMDSRPEPGPSRGGDAAERLEDLGPGSLSSSQVFGQETLEDKAQKLAAEQKMAALRVKFTGEVEDAARQLISGEVEPASAYPEQAQELERRLRRFGRRKEQQGGKEAPAAVASVAPVAAASAAPAAEASAAPVAAAPAAAAATPSAAQLPGPGEPPAATQGTTATVKGTAELAARRPSADGCCHACFAGLRRR